MLNVKGLTIIQRYEIAIKFIAGQLSRLEVNKAALRGRDDSLDTIGYA
jgi:hypothetical protein